MTFHTSWRYRILTTLWFVFIPLLWLGLSLIGLPMDSRLWNIPWWGVMIAAGVLILLSYFYLLQVSYRVTLAEKGLIAGSPFESLRKPEPFLYEFITKVWTGEGRGIVRMDSRQDVLQVNAAVLQGGPQRLLAELEGRLPRGVIAPDLPRQVMRRRPEDTTRTILEIAVAALLAIIILTSGEMNNRLGSWAIWHWDTRLGISPEVSAFAFDREGNPWIAISQANTPQRAMIHLTPGELPFLPLPEDMPGRDPLALGYDSTGQPWAVFEDEILRWSGNEWQKLPLPENDSLVTLLDVHSGALALSYSDRWYTYYEDLYGIDWETGVIQPLPLPASLDPKGGLPLGLHPLPDGAFLAYFPIQNRVYLFRDGNWQEEGYPVPAGETQDITQDTQGVLWALNTHNRAAYISRFDAQAKKWQEIPLEFCCGQIEHSSMIEVDPAGRIWVAATAETSTTNRFNVLIAYQPVENSQLSELVYYSEQNSGYTENEIRLGPDGRLWNGAKWIDTSAAQLPHPLPTWLIFSGAGNSILCVAQIAIMVLYFVLARMRGASVLRNFVERE